MKQFNFSKTSKMLMTLLCSIMIAFTLVSCEKNVYNPDNGKGDESTPNTFPFETTSSIQLNVKYDVPEGYKVLFEVYFENPFVLDKDGQAVKRTNLSPAVTRMTDGNGAYNGKETVTADRGNEVYIYTSYIGVPGLFKTTINDNIVNADINFESISKAAPQTRAYTTAPAGYYTLGNWDKNGRPDYLDTEGQLTLSKSILNTINNTLQEGGICPELYRQSIDFKVNDPKNRKAEVSVRFIGGNSSAASTFGYYCYKDGATAAAIKNAKKYIIFPNTFTVGGWNKPIALKGGECVKLHYIDENGVDQGTEFPNGTKIGWFLINDAYNNNSGNGTSFYSTTDLNGDKRTHTAAFRINDFVVLSFEDWYDYDYNDVMFNIWSNPIEAIAPEVPEVPEEKPDEGDQSIAYSMTYKGIVAFEDNWPSQGDYDLNDVIVKYNSVIRFNTKNEVLNTEDTFTALWSGANYKNGFAYQLNTDRSNVTTSFTENPTAFATQGLDQDITKATVNVFLNARDETGSVGNDNTKTSTYKIKNTFKAPVDHEAFGVAPYNPFIFVHSNQGKSRSEVHLINHTPTEKANMELFHTGKDLSIPSQGIYYVAAESYPFAIHLIDAESFSTTEKISIDKSYPKFTNWAKTGGKEDKDWYK